MAADDNPSDAPHPRRNRVTPEGEIVAIPLRGAWMGNRGILHRDGQIVRSYRSKAWITCVLEFKDWRAPQWSQGHYTVLFFHDEAIALAAGHRPCALCRRPAYRDFTELLGRGTAGAPTGARELDGVLHEERLAPESPQRLVAGRAERPSLGNRPRRLHPMEWTSLPDGTFVFDRGQTALVFADALVIWTHRGYSTAFSRPVNGRAQVLTPPSAVRALAAGYPVQIDARARRLAAL